MTFSSKESRKGQISTVKTTKYVVETMRYATFVSKCEIGTQTRSVIKTRPPQDVDVHAIFENPCSQPKTKTPSDDEKGENESHRGSGRRRQLFRPAGRPDVHLETFD